MRHLEILEYPYYGSIFHVNQGEGDEPDTEVLLYRGVMDEHMVTDEEGGHFQTSSYIISIPLVKKENAIDGKYDNEINKDDGVLIDDGSDWVIPKKGDKISITVYGVSYMLTIDNVEPSQLGGVSIYAVRNSW